jgi:hypothetical protein
MWNSELVLTRCGYRCDLCLAYAPNVEAQSENRQILSDGGFRYFGFRLPPEKIYCQGCMAENPVLIDSGCPVRPCVIEMRLANCAQCAVADCEKLAERLVDHGEVLSRVGGNIPEEDYQRFIRPYENKRRLAALKSDGR